MSKKKNEYKTIDIVLVIKVFTNILVFLSNELKLKYVVDVCM